MLGYDVEIFEANGEKTISTSYPNIYILLIKKRLESDLHDEWFVTTNVSALPGRPVGVGAVVHCSLASHMTDCVIQHPEASRPEASPQDWAEATDGRIQCLKITRPGSPYLSLIHI